MASSSSSSSISSSSLISNSLLTTFFSSTSSSAALRSHSSSLASNLLDVNAYDILGSGSASSGSSPALIVDYYNRLTSMLEHTNVDANHTDCWYAMNQIQSVVASASARHTARGVTDASVDGTAALRPYTERWSAYLMRYIRAMITIDAATGKRTARSTPAPSASSSSSSTAAAASARHNLLHPSQSPFASLLTLTAFETLSAVQSRVYSTYVDTRRDIVHLSIPSLVKMLLVLMDDLDTFSPSHRSALNTPKDGLLRSMALLLGYMRSYKHALRGSLQSIRDGVTPYIGHEEHAVRESAADILAACTQIQGKDQPAGNKKKDADSMVDTNANDDDDDDAAASSSRASAPFGAAQTRPDDPWAFFVQQVINTVDKLLDEMYRSADSESAGGSGGSNNVQKLTSTCLALPALPHPIASTAHPLTRAHVLQRQLEGCMSVLVACLSNKLFGSMHVGPQIASITLALPLSAFLAILQRIFDFELSPHALNHITGQPISRSALLAIHPALVSSGLDLLDSLVKLGRSHVQCAASRIGGMVRKLLERYAYDESNNQSAYPRLIPRVYALACTTLSTFGAAGGMQAFVLPALSMAMKDVERVVKVKNLQNNLNVQARHMAAFQGTTTLKSHKESRRSGGGAGGAGENGSNILSKTAHAPDAAAHFFHSSRLASLTCAATAALTFVKCVLQTSGAKLPNQRRIQLDRSMAAIAMAIQSGSWKIATSYRLGIYECIAASVLIPIPASASVSQSEASSNGLFSCFSLLPYAVEFFMDAANNDASHRVATFCASSMQLCSALVHPRFAPLQSARSSFADNESDGVENHDDSSANNTAKGFVRGRDGTMYMQMTNAKTTRSTEDGEQEENDEEEEDGEDEEEEKHEDADAAPSSLSSSSTSLPTPSRPTKRQRSDDDDADADNDDADHHDAAPSSSSSSSASSSKRTRMDDAIDVADDTDVAAASSSSSSSSSALPSSSSSLSSSSSSSLIDLDDVEPMVADAGPDADEGDQGSLWTM